MSVCTHCGEWFKPKYENLRLCFDCFKKRERALEEYDDLVEEIETLRERARLPSLRVPPARLRQLLHLCHPDKHNNSRTATEVTQWLLELREEMQ